jgi:hypothetical protein
LFCIQDLRKLGVHVLLKLVDLPFLFAGQRQPLPQHCRKDLARLRWPARASEPAHAAGPSEPTPAAARATKARPAAGTAEARPPCPSFRPLVDQQHVELALGDRPILVSVGLVKQPVQALVGHLGFGQFAVFVGIKRHHPLDQVVGRRRAHITATARARRLSHHQRNNDQSNANPYRTRHFSHASTPSLLMLDGTSRTTRSGYRSAPF